MSSSTRPKNALKLDQISEGQKVLLYWAPAKRDYLVKIVSIHNRRVVLESADSLLNPRPDFSMVCLEEKPDGTWSDSYIQRL